MKLSVSILSDLSRGIQACKNFLNNGEIWALFYDVIVFFSNLTKNAVPDSCKFGMIIADKIALIDCEIICRIEEMVWID